MRGAQLGERASRRRAGGSARAAAAPRSPPVSRSTASMRRTASGGGSSATKWRTSLVARWRCVAGWSARKRERGWPPASPSGEGAAEQRSCRRARARWGGTGSRGRRGARRDQPVRMRGEGGDVGLGVAGGRADGVQLQALAGEVLVEAAVRCAGRPRLSGPTEPALSQVEQHGGVAHDGQQHVANRPVTWGRIASRDEGADERRRRSPLADADGEVVGPEPDQALAEGRGGGQALSSRALVSDWKRSRARWGWPGRPLSARSSWRAAKASATVTPGGPGSAP